MKKNKGFTLIELLAVIVILAVIALIVTPIVTGIISNAKKSANARSVEGHISDVNYVILSKTMSGNTNDYDGVLTSSDAKYTEIIVNGVKAQNSADNVKCTKYVVTNGTVTSAIGCTDVTTNFGTFAFVQGKNAAEKDTTEGM